MARITRKELKADKFAQEVGLTVTFFEEHRKEIVRYGSIALVVALFIVGYVIYQRREQTARQEVLAAAIRVQETPVATVSATGSPIFPTQQAKDQAAIKAFSDLAAKYSGSSEAAIAQYYLGAILADAGKLAEAEKNFFQVAEKGDARYASLAKLSLAQIYFADGRGAQGEKVLRDLMAHPTVFVSKEQATLALARYFVTANPAEARKLLDPIKFQRGATGQAALSMYGELPPQ
ncbi:MAG: tetratricopeptide repeat protein [Acidobacteriia bacterium]|nr:tetratricopeptide repeat protein [Terriglobia bacterium]